MFLIFNSLNKINEMNGNKITKSNSNIFEKIYFIFFLFLPFIYSDKIIDPVLIPRQIYLTGFICLLGFMILYKVFVNELKNEFSFLKRFLPLSLFAFIVITFISFSKSTSIADSFYVISKLMVEVLFFIITTFLILQKELTIIGLLKAIAAFCFGSIIIAVYQVLTLDLKADFRNSIYQITSTYGNKNLFSSILFLTFPFVIGNVYLLKKWKVASIILLSSMILLIILIQTRAVIIASILSFVIFIIPQKGYLLKGQLKKVAIISTITIGIVIFIFLEIGSYYGSLIDFRSVPERFLLWTNSFQMAKENMMLGVGAGNWQFIFPKYGLDKFKDVYMDNASLTFQRPHNDFLWVLCETGIFGLAAYLSVFVLALFYLFKLLRTASKPENNLLYYGLFSTIIGYVFISFVDFPLERIEHQVILFLILSIIVASYHNEFQSLKPTTNYVIKPGILMLIIFVPVFISFLVCINRYSGEFHTQKIYDCQSQANWNQLILVADKSMNPYYSADPTSIPINWYKGVAYYTLGNLKEAESCFEKAILIHPYNIHVLNNLASCYETQGKHKEAVETYIKALTISPRFDEARLNLSAVYFNAKEYEKAFKLIDKVEITTKDEKYKIYLPVILKAWIGVILDNQKDVNSIKKISDIINSQDKMLEVYLLSKKNKTPYIKYILNNQF